MSKQQILYLSSNDDTCIKTDKYTYLRWPLDIAIQNVKAVDLVSVGFPNSIYPINAYNNTMKIIKRDPVAGIVTVEHDIVITENFYSAEDYLNELKAQIAKAPADIKDNLVIVLDAGSRKLEFENKDAKEDIEIEFDESEAWMNLGFENSSPIVITNGNKVKSTKMMYLGQIPYYFITSNIPTNTLTTMKRNRNNILAKIDVQPEPTDLMVYNVSNLGVSNFESFIEYLDYIEVRFTDWKNRDVLFYDMNNLAITLKLVIWYD